MLSLKGGEGMNKLKHIVLEACYRVAVSAAESAMNTTCFGVKKNWKCFDRYCYGMFLCMVLGRYTSWNFL